MSVIVDPDWLMNRLENTPENTVVVDTRFKLTDPDAGRKAYVKGHIPQAVYLDLNKDLSGKQTKHGGTHPLPDMDMFAAKVGNIGIDHDTTVVIYDQQNDMFASRLWWLLNYMGHEDVYVLDGGFDGWVEQGYDVTIEIPSLEPKDFDPEIRDNEEVDIDEVKDKLQHQSATLIDSRSQDRYLGKTEPLYKKAGHIPGAKNFFWKHVLDENGKWKKQTDLEEHFSALSKNDEIIVSCGSGVSACPNILALKSAGYENVKLYPGSFSDWISYDDNKIEIKDE
ncbi:thiosulfate/3-mercaptopyruvate sulfurtransferase [Lentibacillus halodurans]|uniref:Thiosulfate/3-mercaptopyruvate sulfurtransferase n=1 Tax=Lentibacillus halodurans TaxID=237679 RepID=A0A1I0XWP2_9BACI|nr:sulfurtransferase [Lentibacillus halodurans]SFB05432.1 thiosulfate/3-mercaptopyruvate sulfurtransferase [Lentibacillus halodurans]